MKLKLVDVDFNSPGAKIILQGSNINARNIVSHSGARACRLTGNRTDGNNSGDIPHCIGSTKASARRKKIFYVLVI